MKPLISFVVFFAFFYSGCATILRPGPDRIHVSSNPEGATVYLDGQQVGKTPMMLTVYRRQEGVIELRKEGYDEQVIDLDKVANGWIFANVLLGGVPGIIVDLATHNQGMYSSSPIARELVQSNKRSTASK